MKMSRSLFTDMEMDLAVFTVGVLILAFSALSPLSAQDFGFGFGFDDEAGADATGGSGGNMPNGNMPSGIPLAVSIGGEVSASLAGYVHDFADGADAVKLGDLFSGKLNFTAESSRADAVLNLKLRPQADSPVAALIAIDEAYVRAYFGGFDIEGGLRKLTWGKADALGPLDVINPLDYADLSVMSQAVSDPMVLKIARPLIHASYRIGSFSKIEGVFVPAFEPAHFADKESRWYPAQMAALPPLPVTMPDTAALTTIEYAQAGARFTTTVGPADIGLQYYYGRMTRPAVTMTFAPSLPPTPTGITFAYNPYHQIGVDWAQVLFGFNIRAEAAANITEDLAGDDGAVYNPSLAWSFGFDRVLFWGISANLQVNESITLLRGKINSDPLVDMQADTDATSTQIIASLSKTFFRDELEARVSVFWEAEAGDFLVMPSLVWTKDAVSVELSGGIFGGDKAGQFGQYRDNGFVKAALAYMF
jgi:hypothetical protein